MRTYGVLAVAVLVLAGCAAASSSSSTPMGPVHSAAQRVQIRPAEAPAFTIQLAPSKTQPSTVIGHAVSNGTTSPQPPGSSSPVQASTSNTLAPGPACMPGTHLRVACTAP
ncbi:MAG TPA: hypothetical protein VGR77_11765 [Candidatus Dormibacteraeota bacterium]|nr:hypothetical protein [Candidatus Dormibacteraeota bacterium]